MIPRQKIRAYLSRIAGELDQSSGVEVMRTVQNGLLRVRARGLASHHGHVRGRTASMAPPRDARDDSRQRTPRGPVECVLPEHWIIRLRREGVWARGLVRQRPAVHAGVCSGGWGELRSSTGEARSTYTAAVSDGRTRSAMPRPCKSARWVSAPNRSTRIPSPMSLRVFSASPETHRRLCPGLRGGILQGPWPYKAVQPTGCASG